MTMSKTKSKSSRAPDWLWLPGSFGCLIQSRGMAAAVLRHFPTLWPLHLLDLFVLKPVPDGNPLEGVPRMSRLSGGVV